MYNQDGNMQMVYSGVITHVKHVKLYPRKWFSFLQDQHFRPLLWQSKPDLLYLQDLFELYPHKWSIQGLSPMLNYIHTNGLFRGYHSW